VGLRLALPDVMAEAGILRWLYIGILLSMLPVVTLLGHYGGKLASQPRPAKPAGGGKESA